jgi:Domain of unknown function (DU1801)
MQSKAATVAQYLAELPPDRRAAIEAVRKVFLANLDRGFEEHMSYGMIGYSVPHKLYPAGYHCDPKQPLPYAGLASQKGHMSLYLFGLYSEPEYSKWFETEWKKRGKKLDMGKCCVRFKKLEDLALDVVADAIRRVDVQKHIEFYERSRGEARATSATRSAARKAAKSAETAAAKKPAAVRARKAKPAAPAKAKSVKRS